MKSTLLLNASYEPLSVVSAQRAVTLIVQNKAMSLDDSPFSFGATSISIPVPYVVRLNKFVKRGKGLKAPRFSRRGVLVRDNHSCAYCGGHADTIDHVIPRDAGGTSTYENCVAACFPCNSKKANRFLKDLGWSLPFVPKAPSLYEHLLNKTQSNPKAKEYILMYAPSLKDKVKH